MSVNPEAIRQLSDERLLVAWTNAERKWIQRFRAGQDVGDLQRIVAKLGAEHHRRERARLPKIVTLLTRYGSVIVPEHEVTPAMRREHGEAIARHRRGATASNALSGFFDHYRGKRGGE